MRIVETVLEVNGHARRLALPPHTLLVDALRIDLGLKGTRYGCGEGYCGSCTVLVDGRPVQSCDTKLTDVAGCRVTTIEALEDHPVRQAVLAEQAAQCGYCTNGIIMGLAGALAQTPPPSRDAILTMLDERHLCRCGAQGRILRALDRVLAGAA
jgi:nicotinate dehydrogenase subunit A